MDAPLETGNETTYSYYLEPLIKYSSKDEVIQLSTSELDFLSPENQALLLSSPPVGRQQLLHAVVSESTGSRLALPRSVRKYYTHRYHLFSRWDSGIQYDEEGLFSVTPECLALYTAIRCSCNVVVDAFAGIGGNSIQLARTCRRVISIDINMDRLHMLQHNSTLYKVEKKIDCICGDAVKLLPSLKADVVLLAPPWGGVNYKKKEVFHLEDLPVGLEGQFLFSLARKITKNVVFVLPRMIDRREVASLADPGEMVEFVEGFVDGHLKMMIVLFGALAHQGNEENTTLLLTLTVC